MSILGRAKSALRDPASALVNVLNVFYAKSAKGDKRPAFYDIDKTYPEFRILDRGYKEIRTELESLLERKDALPRYHDLLKSETYVSG
jgi:aspartate beta-hydroxylase/beta-hydroxylase